MLLTFTISTDNTPFCFARASQQMQRYEVRFKQAIHHSEDFSAFIVFVAVTSSLVSSRTLWCQRFESWMPNSTQATLLWNQIHKTGAACLCALLCCIVTAEPWTSRTNDMRTAMWWGGNCQLSFFFAWYGCCSQLTRECQAIFYFMSEGEFSKHKCRQMQKLRSFKDRMSVTACVDLEQQSKNRWFGRDSVNRSVWLFILPAWPLLC